MRAKEYIEDIINKLVVIYPNLKVLYKFDQLQVTHFIYVTPSVDVLSMVKIDVISHFIHEFPTEAVLFIESDDLDYVKNPDLVITGSEYVECNKCSELEPYYLGTTCPACNRPFRSVNA